MTEIILEHVADQSIRISNIVTDAEEYLAKAEDNADRYYLNGLSP